MKRFFLTILFIPVIFLAAHSQVCTPMWVDTGYGISPDTIVNLPPAYMNTPYDATVQFKVPPSANNLTIDHVVLSYVDGLLAIPASLTFYSQCNPPNCSFKHDSVGCVRIHGTPTTPGTYNLIVKDTVYLTPNLFVRDSTPGYRIVVHYPIGIPAISQTKFDVSQNLPNPVANKTDIYVNLEHAGNFSIKISNLVGNEMFRQTIAGKKGLNTVNLDASRFAPGIYFYSVSDGANTMTKRMVVDRK